MEERAKTIETKTRAESRAEATHIMLAADTNGRGNLFGGKLLEWIDIIASVACRRHSGHDIVTASIEKLDFLTGVNLNETVVLIAELESVGNTSMRVRVDSFVEDHIKGTRQRINEAHLVLVAIDENYKPVRVPRLA